MGEISVLSWPEFVTDVPATSEYFRRDVRTLLEMSEDVPMTFEEFECIDTEPNVVSVKRASAAHLIGPKRMLPLIPKNHRLVGL